MDRGGTLSEQPGRGKERRAKAESWVMRGRPTSPLLAGVGAGFDQRRKRRTREVGEGVRNNWRVRCSGEEDESQPNVVHLGDTQSPGSTGRHSSRTGVGLTPSLGGGAGPRAPVLWPDQLDM